ncbi:MAG: D-alanyl-D-alanine carboxypeptidase [Ilumatobacteraceae bacterium]
MTQPGRGQLNPVVALVLVALVPALLLVGLRSLVSPGEAEPAVEITSEPSSGAVFVSGRSIMSVRRVAPELSGRINRSQLATALQTVTSSMAPTSCLAMSVDGVPLSLSGDRAAIPASTVKILVAAAAVESLGADFTFTTRVMGPSPVDGVVKGDIVLVGGGDPLLSGDWYPNSNLDRYPVFGHTSLDDLARALASAGVTTVNGRVLGDGSRYDDEWYYRERGD